MRLVQHLELLSRVDRSLRLRDVLEERVFPGASVLDAGCGTGLLSLWAARAGAARVVGIDLIDVSVARELAFANQVGDRVSFVQGDLKRDVPDERFDVVLAMVYNNDPRRDETQSQLAYETYRSYLKAGGVPVPDRVRYLARGVRWPAQSVAARWRGYDERVARLSGEYDLDLSPFAQALRQAPDPKLFPPRNADGTVTDDDVRALTPDICWLEIDYRRDAPRYPAEIALTAIADDTLQAVVWTQELWSGDVVLFSNESVSWVHPEPHVRSGDSVRLALNDRWRHTNVLTVAS